MARFDSGIFGFLRGKIGNIVARKRYGETYVSRKPNKINANQTKPARDNRKRFSRTQRLNHQIHRHPQIRNFWKLIDADGLNDNTRVFKRNSKFVTHEVLLPGCGFTPKNDNTIEVKDLSIRNFNINFDYKLNRANPKALKPPYDLYFILLLEKVGEGFGSREFLSVLNIQRIESESKEGFNHFHTRYNDVDRQSAEQSVKRHLMLAAIKFDEQKNNYEWSDTNFTEITDFVSETAPNPYGKHHLLE